MWVSAVVDRRNEEKMRDLMENKEKKTENGKKSNLTRIYITAVLLFHISKTYRKA